MCELWDLYDENRKPLNKIHKRGIPLQNGEYHLVVEIWVINSDGQVLITKRHPQKSFGGMWECTGGSVVAGEASDISALRELEEETGIKVTRNELTMIESFKMENRFIDTYIVRNNISISDLVLQKEEVVDAKIVSIEELNELCRRKEIVPTVVERLKIYRHKIKY